MKASWTRSPPSSGTWSIGHRAHPTPDQAVQTAPRVALDTRDSDQAHLRLGVRGIQTDHPDRYAMQVLGAVLGGGMSSRLFTEVRERNGLAYYVFAHHAAYADTGTLFSQAGVDTDRIDLAVTTILKEFRAMAAEPVGEDELRRVKNYLKGRMVLQLEDSRGLITFGLRREVLENRSPSHSEVLDGIEAVTAADVQRRGRADHGRTTASTSAWSGRSTTRTGSWSCWRRSPQCRPIETTRCFARHLADAWAILPADTRLWDAHTHLGVDDDGFRQTPSSCSR